MSKRYPEIPHDQFTPDQRRVYDAITARRPRGVKGPFVQLMYTPELNSLLQLMTAELRYKTAIPEPERLTAILSIARHWDAQVEFFVHMPLAREQGFSEELIKQFARGQHPTGLTEGQEMVYDFVQQVLVKGRVSDETFDKVAGRFGKVMALELTMLIGAFTILAHVLNVTGTPFPEGETPPLDPPITR